MPKFEKYWEEQPKLSFDYEEAADLARQRLALEGAINPEEKQQRSHVKKKIKELYGSGEQPKRRIFDLELQKQRVALEKEEAIRENEIKLKVDQRAIEYDPAQKQFEFPTEKGFSQKVSRGDLLTDINWELYYQLDEEVPEDFKKQYIEAVYQSEADKLYNQQLIIQRTELEKEQIDEYLAETYKKVSQAMEKGGAESAGLLFEKMIHNLLAKTAIDLQKWGIKVEKATVIEDVEQKIDFIIKHKKNRGVGIEEIEETKGEEETLGIQFTLKSAKSEDFKKKQRQVARALKNPHEVDDLVLISVPVDHDKIFGNYKKWQRHDKLPGGPENCFDVKVIVNVIKEILQNTELTENKEFMADLEKYFKEKR